MVIISTSAKHQPINIVLEHGPMEIKLDKHKRQSTCK